MKKIVFGLTISLFLLTSVIGAEAPARVFIAKVDDQIINPVVSEYILEAIDKAESQKPQCLIIEMDTPGGLLTSTRVVVKRILNAQVPIVVYIYPSGSRAASAGVFITLASHIAAMAPSTNIGAAHPVSIGGPFPGMPQEEPAEKKEEEKGKQEQVEKESKPEEAKGEKAEETEKPEETKPEEKDISPTDIMSEKIINDTTAWVRAIARFRGRNAEWAEKAVRESVSITEEEAVEKNVIDLVSASEKELLEEIDGKEVKIGTAVIKLATKDATIEYIPFTARRRLLSIIVNPNIAYILLILGFYGLLFEVTHPGIGVPGIAGVLCLILAAYALHMLPVNYAGLILIILAILMFIAEVKVASYGLLTLGGLICMTIGSLMLIKAPAPFTGVSLQIVLPIVVATAVIVLFLISLVLRTHSRRAVTGQEGLVGEIGTVEVPLQPEGKIFVHGEYWDAWSNEPIEKGTKVKITAVKGLKVKVERTK